jgi:hypothetical protein
MAAGLSSDDEELKESQWGKSKKSLSIHESFSYSSSDTVLTLWKKSFKKSKKDTFMWDNIF